MLQTDLNGLINQIKDNKFLQLLGLIILCVIGFYLVNKLFYNGEGLSRFSNIVIGTIKEPGGRCSNNVAGLDKALIENTINLPNRNPKLLTSSMVIPELVINEEKQRTTRMEILNMFYDTMDSDNVSILSRPKGLYMIP